MSEPQPAAPDRLPALIRTGAGRAALLAGAFALFCVVSLRPVVHSEARYVESAREMVANGDWVVPHLSFVPYFEKPILTYWLAALSQLVLGMGPVAVRMPSILACTAMVWTTYAWGRSLCGTAFGVGAAALLTASAVFLEMGTAITTDPVFSAFLAFCWYAYRRHTLDPRGPWIWAFWASLGLGFLAKGPLGPALVGSSVFFHLLLARRLPDLVKMRFVRGLALLVAINLPWSYLVWQRDPRFLEFFYVRQNLRAFTSDEINHPGPPWYYLELLPAVLFPFALLGVAGIAVQTWKSLAPAVRHAFAGGTAPDDDRTQLVCAVVPPLLLLSLAGSKLGTYLLPLFPALTLLAALHVAERLERRTWDLRYLTLAQSAALAVAVAAVPFVAGRLPPKWHGAIEEDPVALGVAAVLLVVPALAGSVWMARGRILPGMALVAAGTAAGVVQVNEFAAGPVEERLCAPLMPRLVAARRPGEKVIVTGPNVDDYTIVLALRDRPHVWGFARELGMGHFAEVTSSDVPFPQNPYDVSVKGGKGGDGALPSNPWLVDEKRLRAMWTGPERVWFIGRPKTLAQVRDLGLEAGHVLAANDENVIATNQPLPR